jgi:DNA/RNA endonuclease YhcR with UshA esterase domain
MAYLDSTGVTTLTSNIKALSDAEYKQTKKSISLSATWSGNDPYTQTVTISGYTITANSKVDLQPDASQIAQLIEDGVQALYIANNNGTLTAYAVGAETSTAMTIQCTVTEVA